MRKITHLIIHHSASRGGTIAEFRALHMARLGASDIGYHNVIGSGVGIEEGVIASGRPHAKAGAGVYDNNTGKLQVCVIGNFERSDSGYTGPPTRKQMFALGHWLYTNGRRYGMTDYRKVQGHKEVAVPGHATACPGSEMPLKQIRQWFQANIGKVEPEGLDSYLLRDGVKLG